MTTAAAVNAYRSKDEVADQVLNLSTQLLSHAVIGATAVLSTLQREWSFWLAEILDFYAHIVQPSAQFIALELMTAAHNAQSMIDGACVFVRGRVAPVAARARQTFALCDDSAYSQTVCQSAVGAHALRRSIDGLRKQTLGLQLFADAALVRGKRHVAQSGRHFAEKVTSLRDGLTSVQKNIWSRYDSLGDALEVVFQPDEL